MVYKNQMAPLNWSKIGLTLTCAFVAPCGSHQYICWQLEHCLFAIKILS